MHAADIHRWGDRAVESLAKRGIISPALVTDNKALDFIEIAQQTHRLPVFQDLLQEELETIASRLIFRSHPKRETLFYKGDIADRMYIIKQGRVSLINPSDKHHTPSVLRENDVFGGLAFLTGARHTVSAITTEDTALWVLRQKDLEELLQKAPTFRDRLKDFLKQTEVSDYLEERLHYDPDKASRWIASALDTLDHGKPLPAAQDVSQTIRAHGGAVMAIWLGILLDGYRSPWSSDPACFIPKSASP